MGVGASEVVAIFGRHKRNPGFTGQFDEIPIDPRLDFHSLILYLEEEIPFAKNVLKPIRVGFRLVVFFRDKRVSHFAAQARRKRD